jgi:hypothetical protein
LKVAGCTLPTCARSVFAPSVGPSVQLPTVATPSWLVVCSAPVIVPPPLATEKVTVAPATAVPLTSLTRTDGATSTGAPTPASWSSPAILLIWAGTPSFGPVDPLSPQAWSDVKASDARTIRENDERGMAHSTAR